jgi:hypothetical protein
VVITPWKMAPAPGVDLDAVRGLKIVDADEGPGHA